MESATILALAGITNAGRFERLATAVLRLDARYAALSHPGVNAKGGTIKSPVDGITLADGGNHLIAAHHTVTSAESLERKWLLDPATVKRRANSKSPPPLPGDVLKTLEIVRKERERTPELLATLVLTTNEEVDFQLHLDVVAAGRAEGVEVDVWPRSRIAYHLDTNPVGQLIRRKLLDISEQLISRELLVELSRRNLQAFDAHDEPSRRVERTLDSELSRVRRPLTFVVGASGSGKTVAAHKALLAHAAAGGVGLVISTDAISQAMSLDQAVMAALRAMEPSLAVGQSPTALFSNDDPLLLLIEDASRTGQPQRLIERLASWVPNEKGTKMAPSWRILCPVWPHLFGGVSSQVRKQIDGMSMRPAPMTLEEAGAAVAVQAVSSGVTLDVTDARRIAEALGNDPLLIGLNADWTSPRPSEVVGRFVEEALERCAHVGPLTTGDLRRALLALCKAMLKNRRLAPMWDDVLGWSLAPEHVGALRVVVQGAEVLWLEGASADLRLSFRHDRVRNWLLVDAAVELDRRQELADGLLAEPLLAEVMAGAAVRLGCPWTFVTRLRALSPLALFHGMRLSTPESAATIRLVGAAKDWLGRVRPAATLQLRWHALAAIESVEAEWMLDLVRQFPRPWPTGQTARFRNGDLQGALDMCCMHELQTVVTWLADAALSRKRRQHEGTTEAIRGLLDARPLPPNYDGVLRLAGVWGEPSLGSSIARAWKADEDQGERLAAYLWAAARCATPLTVAELLNPICAAWASLPTETKKGQHAIGRNDLAAHSVRWAFDRAAPEGAIAYFIDRAKSQDLAWPIEYMLHSLDSPKVVVFEAECGAARLKVGGYTYFANCPARHYWEQGQWNGGSSMSKASRDVVLAIWTDAGAEKELRVAAFDLWAASHTDGDLEALRPAAGDVDLADRVLRERLERGDAEALAELLPLLRGERLSYWWQFARHIWSPEICAVLDETLTAKAGTLGHEIGSALIRTIVRLPVPEAEGLLLRHWDAYSKSSHFVLAALFVATPRLKEKAAAAIDASDDPKRLLEHLTMHFGINTAGEPGITREEQIWALRPYLFHLPPYQLMQLADDCNRKGLYDVRRDVIDPMLPDGSVPSFEWFRSTLNREVQSNHLWIVHSVDRALDADVPWVALADTISSWLPEQTSEHALRIAAKAIMHAGTRADVEILKRWGGQDNELLSDTLADVSYSVARRSAQ